MVEVAGGAHEAIDFHAWVIPRFKNSAAPEHRHLCAVVGAIAQVLQEQGLPSSPTAYFAATMSSLERHCKSAGAGDDPVITALCTFLAMVLPRTPVSVLRSKGGDGLMLLLTLLGGSSKVASGTLKAALSCITSLLQVADKSDWPSFAPAYGVLVKHCLDQRPKVRKRAHQCVAEVLSGLQGSPSVGPANDLILNLFERSLMAVSAKSGAGHSEKAQSALGNTGALEVLYLLNALKIFLPFMSDKAIGKVLVHLSALFELRQPFLTRHVLNALQPLFADSNATIPAAGLADLLGRLSALLLPERKAIDESTVATRILQHGMKKLYCIDENLCALKLPAVFHSLAGVLASEHEEVIFEATGCLKSLIENCIDKIMIHQGVSRVKILNEAQKSGPTPVERICATADSTLGYHYSHAWDMSLQVISTLFNKLGSDSSTLMADTVKTLAELEELSDDNLTCRKQLHKTLGAAVAAMGPDQFLALLPIHEDGEDLLNARMWLLPILKQNIVGARLQFFAEEILSLTLLLQEKAQKCSAEGRPVAAKNAEAFAQSLWALLPSFCNYPSDTKENFRRLAKQLGDALMKEPELRGVICHSLQILIGQNKLASGDCAKVHRAEQDSIDNNSAAEEKAKARYSQSVAVENLTAIASFSRNFLPVLFNIFITSTSDKRADLQITIGAYASISDKATVKNFFIAIMQKLLKATKDAADFTHQKSYEPMEITGPGKEESPTSRRCIFMDLAISLLQGLDDEEVSILFKAIKPALQDGDGTVQKRAYKVLASLCKEHAGFLNDYSNEILELLLTSMPSCHFSAKRHRLMCLHHLILHLFKSDRQKENTILSSFISEIIIATKEPNKKTRNLAYDTLVDLGHSLEDNDTGGNLFEFFIMIVGCLAGTTPHMTSAAVTGLARLIYEFSDLCHKIPDLLPSVLLLLHSKSREVIKSVLGLIKVAIARQAVEDLQQHLKDMVEGLLLWSDDSKNHFKAKVRVIVEMLVRKCGLQAVSAVMPQQHMRLLTSIRKKKEQKERRSYADGRRLDDTKSVQSHASTTRHSRWSHTEVFSDLEGSNSDDDQMSFGTSKIDREGMPTKSRASIFRSSNKLRKSKRRLPEDSDVGFNEPLDLLDTQKTRAALSAHSTKKTVSDIDDFEVGPDGRFIILDEDDRVNHKRKRLFADSGDEREFDSRSARSRNSSAHLHQSEKATVKSGKNGSVRGLSNKKKKLETGWAYSGEEYASKKGTGKGDVKQEGKLEPYAYWPLDPKMLNRREGKKAAARKGLASVLKMTKKMQGMSAVKALALKSSVRRGKHKTHKGHKNKAK